MNPVKPSEVLNQEKPIFGTFMRYLRESILGMDEGCDFSKILDIPHTKLEQWESDLTFKGTEAEARKVATVLWPYLDHEHRMRLMLALGIDQPGEETETLLRAVTPIKNDSLIEELLTIESLMPKEGLFVSDNLVGMYLIGAIVMDPKVKPAVMKKIYAGNVTKALRGDCYLLHMLEAAGDRKGESHYSVDHVKDLNRYRFYSDREQWEEQVKKEIAKMKKR